MDCDFSAVGTPQPGLAPTGLNMTDLELLHNYTTTTYLTLSESPVRLSSLFTRVKTTEALHPWPNGSLVLMLPDNR